MSASAKPSLSKDFRTYLSVAFAAMTVFYLLTFLHNHALHHILDGVGFALLAYGTYRNGLVTEARNLGGRYASLIGGGFLLASAVVTSAPAISALVRAIG